MNGREKMNILVAVDNGYIEPLMVMLTSLFDTNHWSKTVIYLLYSNVSDKNLSMLKDYVNKSGNKIECIKVSREMFDHLPTRSFSEETYYRLLACRFLPQNVDKILFLDPDMIVKQSLEQIYTKKMGKYYYFAVTDNENEAIEKFRKIFRLPKNYPYVNSGFLLMNISLMRQNIDVTEIIDFIKSNANRLTYLDQDVLNALFHDNIYVIPSGYNYDTRFRSIRDIVTYPYQLINLILQKEIYVLHYKGPDKPWKKGYGGKFGLSFYRNSKVIGDKEINKNNSYNIFTWIYYLKKQYLMKFLMNKKGK
jgi:lipopolysaccharide biosynthesis glycosyltransferase